MKNILLLTGILSLLSTTGCLVSDEGPGREGYRHHYEGEYRHHDEGEYRHYDAVVVGPPVVVVRPPVLVVRPPEVIVR